MMNLFSANADGSRSKARLIGSYVFDYAIIIIFIVVFSAFDKMEPFHQRFSKTNISIQYPFAEHERIPPFYAGLISCAFPLLVIAFYSFIIDGLFSHTKHRFVAQRRRFGLPAKYTINERLWEFNCGVLGLGLSVAAAIFVTGAMKNAVGKPRPDMLSRCDPDPTVVEPPIGLLGWEICKNKGSHLLRDGFKSFPSGHTSTAFAGLGYLSLYLAGKLHVMDNRGEVWKTVLVIVPLVAASLVAISRIMDARHHPFDVLFGSVLGLAVAWASYRQYFPSITEVSKKGRAYPVRTWGTLSGDTSRIEDTKYEGAPVARADTFDHATDEEAGFGQPGMHYKASQPGVHPSGTTNTNPFASATRQPVYGHDSMEMSSISSTTADRGQHPTAYQSAHPSRSDSRYAPPRQQQGLQTTNLTARPNRSFSSEESSGTDSSFSPSTSTAKADIGVKTATAAVYGPPGRVNSFEESDENGFVVARAGGGGIVRPEQGRRQGPFMDV